MPSGSINLKLTPKLNDAGAPIPNRVDGQLIPGASYPCDDEGRRLRGISGSPVLFIETTPSGVTEIPPGGNHLLYADILCANKVNGARIGFTIDITKGQRVALPVCDQITVTAYLVGIGGRTFRVDAFLDWFAQPSGIEAFTTLGSPTVDGDPISIPGAAAESAAITIPNGARSLFLVGTDAALVRSTVTRFKGEDGTVKYLYDDANAAMPIIAGVKTVTFAQAGAAFTGFARFALCTG